MEGTWKNSIQAVTNQHCTVNSTKESVLGRQISRINTFRNDSNKRQRSMTLYLLRIYNGSEFGKIVLCNCLSSGIIGFASHPVAW